MTSRNPIARRSPPHTVRVKTKFRLNKSQTPSESNAHLRVLQYAIGADATPLVLSSEWHDVSDYIRDCEVFSSRPRGIYLKYLTIMIITETQNNALWLRLDSGKGNLLGQAEIDSLRAIVHDAESNSQVSFVCLTGTGQSFCAGANLAEVALTKDAARIDHFFRSLDSLLLELFSLSKPLVAVVNGHSIGAGFLLQGTADMVFLPNNPRIKLGLPELELGLTFDNAMQAVLEFYMGTHHFIQDAYAAKYFGVDRAAAFLNTFISEDASNCADAALQAGQQLAKNAQGFAHLKGISRESTRNCIQMDLEHGGYQIFSKLMTATPL
ncbi:MAG TPA: enoyl-CoA hydratase/isomerase family protein [Polyangiaceae bacterium]